jgi:hypothetical protein
MLVGLIILLHRWSLLQMLRKLVLLELELLDLLKLLKLLELDVLHLSLMLKVRLMLRLRWH